MDCPFTHCLQQWLRVIGYMFWRPFHSHHSLNSINFNLLFPLPFHLFYSIKRRRMRLFSSLGQRKRRRQASRNGISETNGMEWLCGRGAEPITHFIVEKESRSANNSINSLHEVELIGVVLGLPHHQRWLGAPLHEQTKLHSLHSFINKLIHSSKVIQGFGLFISFSFFIYPSIRQVAQSIK